MRRVTRSTRYCLNDLHLAAGGEKRHGPSYWMANDQTRALIEELGPTGIPGGPTVTFNDGVNNGPYVAKELVYAYAMRISALPPQGDSRNAREVGCGPMSTVLQDYRNAGSFQLID